MAGCRDGYRSAVAVAPSPLTGRVAIVVLGLGSTEVVPLAGALAAAGAIVVVAGADGTEAAQVLAAVEDAGTGRKAFFKVGNDPGDAAALVEFVAEQFRAGPEAPHSGRGEEPYARAE